MCLVMYHKTAAANAYPSKVEVPQPSSSKTANDFEVPCYKSCFVSSISTKNVLLFSRILSDAPILVNTQSNIVILQLLAGTKHPI